MLQLPDLTTRGLYRHIIYHALMLLMVLPSATRWLCPPTPPTPPALHTMSTQQMFCNIQVTALHVNFGVQEAEQDRTMLRVDNYTHAPL